MTTATMNPLLSALAPISLDELIEVAALQTRVDRKYIFDREALDGVLADLAPDARMLDIGGRRSFGYESVYFDTPDLASYLAAAHRRRRRFKVRTRTYVDSAECYLEVKMPGGRSSTVKERLEHDSRMPDRLGHEGEAYAAEVLEDAQVDVTQLRPVMRTEYQRATLYVPGARGAAGDTGAVAGSRATIDTALAWTLGAGGRGRIERLDLPHLVIVETKSGSTPSAVDRLLWRHGHRPASLSKYATGMAAMDARLPANKWAPVLRAHFGAQSHLTNRTERTTRTERPATNDRTDHA